MPRNYGHGGDDSGCFDGSGGASGQYGSQTPLDGIHRQGVFETDERERYQNENAPREDTPTGALAPLMPTDCPR